MARSFSRGRAKSAVDGHEAKLADAVHFAIILQDLQTLFHGYFAHEAKALVRCAYLTQDLLSGIARLALFGQSTSAVDKRAIATADGVETV